MIPDTYSNVKPVIQLIFIVVDQLVHFDVEYFQHVLCHLVL